MSGGRQVELPLISKAPFANYDLIVYLGGGLLALLISWRYVIQPFGIFDPTDSFPDPKTMSWAAQAIVAIVVIFMAYIAGHLIAYLASYFIEGFINKSLGKFSSVVKLSTCRSETLPSTLRSTINRKISTNFRWERANIPWTKWKAPRKRNFLIWFFHAPVQVWYYFVKSRGYFGFADTRLPNRMFEHLDRKLAYFFGDVSTDYNRQWFRWVEYYTSYNAPVARASMYNYLVISGLMRSIAFLLLGTIWLEILHIIIATFRYTFMGGEAFLITHGAGGWTGVLAYFSVLVIAYICALTSYFKFYSRYVEEAVMGFLLEVPPNPYAIR